MANSPLDFASSDGFRKKLLNRNLIPYSKSPSRDTLPTDYRYIQSDIPVQDSSDKLIDEPSFANSLYPLNQWGSEGGYKIVPDPGILKNSKSNRGEYGPGQQDAFLLDEGFAASKIWKPLNAYSDTDKVFDSAEAFSSLDIVYPDGGRLPNGQPYPNFNPSSYSPLSILLFNNPDGSNGRLSDDSFIARLGAKTIRDEFKERIAFQIRKQTIDRANILNVRGGEDILSIISGRVPILEPNWSITVPQNIVLAATDFALRLGGSILPISPIPGSYFDPTVNPKIPTTFGQITNAFRRSDVGNFLVGLLGANQTGSQLFFNNTGPGQRSRLFRNIDYNKYKPSFERTVFDRVAGTLFGTQNNTGEFYIGSITSDPSRVFSPSGDLPINQIGLEQQSPVYGPQELSQLYEGPSRSIKLGANGTTYTDGGGIEGGLTWVSPKYKNNAGKKVGPNGVIYNNDQDFSQSSFSSTESTNIDFRGGSILDDTQRLIDSQPNGGRRLQHVGNAIDQVSKVFNDGYKEITKGSKVLSYVGEIGQEVGTEYCRVFTKDTPYLQYNDLQKSDGVTTQGRRFSWSVLDNTYNLNIVPNRQEGGKSSTNLINGDGGEDTSYAKKYMFSLENLSWRTSRTPGYTVNDLPVCERGPNGGRVMWFPPYELKFTESSNANWKATDFIGRPEPIYTYNNTNRTGTLSWKIVVDHPSVLNVITNKILSNENNRSRVDSILDSFFAGCRKYDLYELAKKYATVNPNDLYEIQQLINNKEVTREELTFIKRTVQTGVDSTDQQSQEIASNIYGGIDFDEYLNVGVYFPNDYPKPNSQTLNYNTDFNVYQLQKDAYIKQPNSIGEQANVFFDGVIDGNFNKVKDLVKDLKKSLSESESGSITITFNSSTSAPATIGYNQKLSDRRIESFINYIKSDNELKKYVDKSRLLLVKGESLGEKTNSEPILFNKEGGQEVIQSQNCTDSDGEGQQINREIFTQRAMACRRSYIDSIFNNLEVPTTPEPIPNEIKTRDVLTGVMVPQTTIEPSVEEVRVNRDNITKRVVRSLISECDYFEVIKEDSPMVYDNLKEKLKYFQPAFHSTTPEGLNSRLTFLQQCMRPGDTIPTIKGSEGSSEFEFTNSAVNTSFGSPPVLILRVGDFYNTKIIPEGLQIQYEGLDINPEGIGVQPMIANVTLNFKFVGGSGLKSSIDKLQNSLTFNYYANTEMWDDRADSTDRSYEVFDKEFLERFSGPNPPTINQAATNLGQSNGSTIGVVMTNEFNEFETGLISYSSFMDGMVNDTNRYFNTIINKNKEVLQKYNNAVRQQMMSERNYTLGNFSVAPQEVNLFGKPKNLENNFNKIFKSLLADIKNDNEGFIRFLNQPSINFSNKLIRLVKNNYINYVKSKGDVYQNNLTTIIQDIVNLQQQYITTLSKINTITFSSNPQFGTDGFQFSNGNIKIYNISGTTQIDSTSINVSNTMEELIEDTKVIQTRLILFNSVSNIPINFTNPEDNKQYKGVFILPISPSNGKSIGDYGVNADNVFIPFNNSLKNDPSLKRVYFALSEEVTDNNRYESFKNSIIGDILSSKVITKKENERLEEVFDKYWRGNVRDIFENENKISNLFITEIEKNTFKDFISFTPFKTKSREFRFTTEKIFGNDIDKVQESLIIGIGSTKNINTKTSTWNDEISSGAYISKSKLN
jgi:hypothetical protein